MKERIVKALIGLVMIPVLLSILVVLALIVIILPVIALVKPEMVKLWEREGEARTKGRNED